MNRNAFALRPAAVLAGALLGLLAGPSFADATVDPAGRQASARLNFVIKVPAVLRILDNSHPSELLTDAQGLAVAEQRLELQSNLKQGFCVLLRQPEGNAMDWSLQASGGPTAVARPVQDGYHLCFSQPGRYVVNLQHSFRAPGSATTGAWSWPVRTEILAI